MTDKPRASEPGISAFIDDGMTVNGYIAAIPRQMPACDFIYRPVNGVERNIIKMEVSKATERSPRAGEQLITEVVAQRMVWWNYERDCNDAKVIGLMQSLMFFKLYCQILGDLPSEPKPGNDERDTTPEADPATVVASLLAGSASPTEHESGNL